MVIKLWFYIRSPAMLGGFYCPSMEHVGTFYICDGIIHKNPQDGSAILYSSK